MIRSTLFAALVSLFSTNSMAEAPASEKDLLKAIEENTQKHAEYDYGQYSYAASKDPSLKALHLEVSEKYTKWVTAKMVAESATGNYDLTMSAVRAGNVFMEAKDQFDKRVFGLTHGHEIVFVTGH